MGRPALEIGKPGRITIREVKPKVFQARCRYRDGDGTVRLVSAQARTKTGAQNALLARLADRPSGNKHIDALKPHHRFTDAARVWLRRVEQEQRGTTYTSYRQWLEGRVLPDIGEIRLSELSGGYLDTYFAELRSRGYTANTMRMIRKVVRGPLKLAYKHKAIVANPVSEIDDIKSDPKSPRALTPEECRRLLAWLDGSGADPEERAAQQTARARDLPDVVRVMLGTGLRVGEVMALRWKDINFDGKLMVINGTRVVIPVLHMTGNIARVGGKGLVFHPGKTDQAQRTVLLPRFVLDVLLARRERLTVIAQGDAPVFGTVTAAGLGWCDPNKVTAWVRDVRQWVGLEWMTTHVWRKTAATIMHEAGIPTSIIADQLGHKHVSMTQDVYLGRGTYSLEAPAALDAAFSNL